MSGRSHAVRRSGGTLRAFPGQTAMTEKLAWADIEPRLRQLRLSADDLKERFPDEADFMPRFADLADDILEAANDACYDDASVRITDMLIDLGYVAEHERQH